MNPTMEEILRILHHFKTTRPAKIIEMVEVKPNYFEMKRK